MDRFTTLIVAGVLALVVAGLAVAVVTRDRQTPPDAGTPSGVVMAYAQAELRGDGQAAWDLLAASARARGDRDRFIARVGTGGTSDASNRQYLSTESEQIDADGTASVTLVRTFARSGGILNSGSYSSRSVVRLVREGDGWRITVPPDDYALSLPRGP